MSRPLRNGVPSIRLTAYISPHTLHQIKRLAELDGHSYGQVIDGFFAEKVAVNNVTPLPLRNPDVWHDHPGWRLNGLGQNVCTACGGVKTRVRSKSCPGPK